jgi:hypothetical protein
MIDKKELLTMLEKAKISEEKSIPIYTKHMGTAIFWTGIDKEKVEKIKEALILLARESERHRKVDEYLIAKIKSEARDAF